MNEIHVNPIAEYMLNRPITDKIILDQESSLKLLDMICPNHDTAEDDFTECFKDLFFSTAIPLPNAAIETIIPVNNEKFHVKELSVTTTIAPIEEFMEANEVQKILNHYNKFNRKTIAIIYLHLPPKFNNILGRLTYNYDIDDCEIKFEGIVTQNNEVVAIPEKNETEMFQTFAPAIANWVCSQIAMLHPTLKYIFNKPKIIGFDKNGKKVKKKKQAVSYIRKHKITTGDIDKELFPFTQERSSHTITCPYWYVIGHWRHYKDHKTWIPGYWKGSMRDLKNKQLEPRERKIITED